MEAVTDDYSFRLRHAMLRALLPSSCFWAPLDRMDRTDDSNVHKSSAEKHIQFLYCLFTHSQAGLEVKITNYKKSQKYITQH
jgi:hypothetical protein